MAILVGVDRAAFVAALVARLRTAGVHVSMTNLATFARALDTLALDRRSRLYWVARTTLVSRLDDVATFDRVFGAVFDDAMLAHTPMADRLAGPALPSDSTLSGVNNGQGLPADGKQLPWATLPMLGVTDDDELDEGDRNVVPDVRASDVAALTEVPFEQLDDEQIMLLTRWLEQTSHSWPTRRSRRVAPDRSGRKIALRRTLSRARRTGWEPLHLLHDEPIDRPRRLVIIVDVSESMRAYATALLSLMRVAVRRTDAEVFAFATSLTRLTNPLKHRSTRMAIDDASAMVTDRFGGTRIATSLRSLLTTRSGESVRGAIVVIASDGWDSDPPAELSAVMARIARRAHRVVWLNPRAASASFEPTVGGMAAALPFCDDFLPAHNFSALADVVESLGAGGRRRHLVQR